MTIDELAEKIEALDAKIDLLLKNAEAAKLASRQTNALDGRRSGPDDG